MPTLVVWFVTPLWCVGLSKFLPREDYASAVLGVVILFVCLFVHLSVCLSRAYFVTKPNNAHEKAMTLVF